MHSFSFGYGDTRVRYIFPVQAFGVFSVTAILISLCWADFFLESSLVEAELAELGRLEFDKDR